MLTGRSANEIRKRRVRQIWISVFRDADSSIGYDWAWWSQIDHRDQPTAICHRELDLAMAPERQR